MLFKILAIFLAGVLTDFLVARYTRAVHEKKPLFAACLSSMTTVCNMTLLAVVLTWTQEAGLLPIAAFAGGNWLGTYFTVRKSV